MKRLSLILSALLAATLLHAQDGPQLYNMGFDTWSKSSGAWNLYPEKPTDAQRVWDTANHGLSILGINGTMPEYKHVAVPGPGKAAAKIVSKKVVWAFVAGNLYNGRFGRVVRLSGAELFFGVPFSARPKSLSGYVHYIPKTVNYALPHHYQRREVHRRRDGPPRHRKGLHRVEERYGRLCPLRDSHPVPEW